MPTDVPLHAVPWQLSPLEKRYDRHRVLWDYILSRQAPSDEDEYSAPHHRTIRNERASAHASPQPAQKSYEACRTRFVAKDDEAYLLVPDVPRSAWQPES